MKDWIKKQLKAKEARQADLVKRSDASTDLNEVRSIGAEMITLGEEIKELRSMLDNIENEERAAASNGDPVASASEAQVETRAAAGLPGQGQMIAATFGLGADMRGNQEVIKKIEARAADLVAGKAVTFTNEEVAALEKRAVTVSGGSLIIPKHESNTLNPSFNEISGIINQVNAVPLPGGDTYSKGYEKPIGEGDYSAEGADYNESEPTFGYVDIVKAKITVYAEITEEVKKLPAVDYASRVYAAVMNMLRKKIAKQIFVGAGGANKLMGILASIDPLTNDIDIDAIDADTLTKIVFGYGGDEDVEGSATLYVNKKTLQAFAEVRGTDSKPVYKIVMNGNSGTIGYVDGSLTVPYTLSSILTTFATTAEDAFFGVYGNPMLYELATFSDVEILESRDYKFKSGQIAYRGSVFVGGSPAAYKGFARLKKNAVA